MLQRDVIKSIAFNQQEIINNILTLYNNGNSIDYDPCYNIGGFYKNGKVKEPKLKSDINPLLPGVLKIDVTNLPFVKKFMCIMFDPPFLIKGGSSTYKMIKRFSYFENLNELLCFYKKSFLSLNNSLKRNGILILKTQDFVNARKNHILLPDIISLARDSGFIIKDLFILLSRSRINNIKKQYHARKYHCYFLVFRKK